jgi:hypothetical protein
MRSLLKFIAKSEQNFRGQRVVAAAMLAEVVTHSGDDAALLRELVKYLLPRTTDTVALTPMPLTPPPLRRSWSGSRRCKAWETWPMCGARKWRREPLPC